MPIRALPEHEGVRRLTASIQDVASGGQVETTDLRLASDGWHEVELPPLAAGTYRVTVRGEGQASPVTDIFVVLREGADIEPGG